ncbi:MAG: glycoside hydrolase 5 family protein [Armatimonadota bacterium]
MSEIDNAQNLYAHRTDHDASSSTGFSELARELRAFDGIVVGVLCDAVYAGHETPSELQFEHIAASWGRYPGVRVVPLNANQIRSYEILFNGKMDILVFPYGGVYPMDAFGLYSGLTFQQFLKRGGAVLTTGGIPFSKQASPFGQFIDTSSAQAMQDAFDKWIAKFGVKYYEPQVAPSRESVDGEFLPGLPADIPWEPARLGLVVVNSSHDPEPKPPHGNVFPERYPARQIIPLMTGYDAFEQHVCTSAILSQDFEDGSRRIHFTHEADAHPLSPDSPHFGALMRNLFGLLTNRIVVREIETEYACYRQGEAVRIRAELVGFDATAVEAQLIVKLLDSCGNLVMQWCEDVVVPSRDTLNLEWSWQPEEFTDDEYTVQIDVIRNGQNVSRVSNGFVVWDEEMVRKGPAIGIAEGYFTINGRGAFITGTNYYESTRGEAMWYRPDVARLIADHRSMHACGVNMIRPHYHHLKWFKDYLLHHHGRLFPFYKSLESLDSAMPDERVWRIWELFISLGQKYGIVYNGDLFTLVPEELGDPRGWFGTTEAVYDHAKRPAQKQFLLELDRRFRNVPGITWDLFNEPYQVTDEAVADWADYLGSALRSDGSTRLLTVGGPMHLPTGVDYDCPHGGISDDFKPPSARPVLLQEAHFDRPEQLSDELAQAEAFRRMVVCCVRNGVTGWCPWSWTRQMRLWQDVYQHHHSFPMEKWDDRLGMHTHEDGTLKPAGQVFKDIAMLMRSVEPLRYDAEGLAVVTSRGTLCARLDRDTGQPSQQIIHANGDLCLGGMAMGVITHVDQNWLIGPEASYLYAFTVTGDLASNDELFIKSEQPGTILFNRTRCVSVDLVDLAPDAHHLAEVPFQTKAQATVINIPPEMTRYWLRLRF